MTDPYLTLLASKHVSAGFEALKAKRKFAGAELKPEYHTLGVKYLREAEALANAPDLFMYMERIQLEEALNGA